MAGWAGRIIAERRPHPGGGRADGETVATCDVPAASRPERAHEHATARTPALPLGRSVDLPGRGTTFARVVPAPPGAPTMLLLHGWTATADLNWFTSYEAVSREFGLVALDHRGHGRGIHTRDRFRLEDCADDAAAVVAELGVGPVVAIGYSMGGPVAQLLWHRHPEMVAGLVLCATSASFLSRPEERMWFAGVDGLARVARMAPPGVVAVLGQRMMTARLRSGPLHEWARTEVTRANPRTVLEAGAALGRFRSTDWIGEVDVPAAVVVTDHDRVVPTSRQERLADAIAGATVHHVDGDHGACVVDDTGFVPTLVEACRSVAGRLSPQV